MENDSITLMSIDPGTKLSGYVIFEYKKGDFNNFKILDKGKIDNYLLALKIYSIIETNNFYLVIEKIESYGMPIGMTTIETIFWAGRFFQSSLSVNKYLIPRKEVKLYFCGNVRAKDGNVICSLKDRYGDKGTKKNPGFFYGFSKDVWQAAALGLFFIENHNISGMHQKFWLK